MIISFIGIDIHNQRISSLESGKSNFVPFESLIMYFSEKERYNLDTWFNSTFGPLLLFLPMGLLLPVVFKNMQTLRSVVLFSFVLSFLIEVLQYVTRLGIMDIDDAILNTAGAITGYLFYTILFKKTAK
ncbi:VanZ family protein [Rossellomorea aquimaris]|uniref:VanZ family protein n=1 Tax=Rossellomorea aquimaris TaxID=189382 RepID=A0A5D4TJK4_9BACI|nr:VanZ family protein [Rossellomorea aquimaris]TYS75515.1 VanZ family protein [Rossellomorea aquimaris]